VVLFAVNETPEVLSSKIPKLQKAASLPEPKFCSYLIGNVMKDRKTVSVIILAFNEAENLPQVFSRLEKQAIELVSKYDFEFIILDNSSTDDTRELSFNQCRTNPAWKYIRYSRNFGAEASLQAGLDHSTGDAAIIFCADMQDPPDYFPTMLAKWESGADVVSGILNERNDSSILKTLGAKIAYHLIFRLTESRIPPNATSFRLLDRKVVEVLMEMREPDRYFRGMVHWVGFKQEYFAYDRQKRVAGNSNAGILHCILYAFNAIMCFSSRPMHLSMYFGLILTVLSVFSSCVYAILFFVEPSFLRAPPPGTTTLILLALFLVGMNSLFLGIIGEYVGRIYRQGKNRPLYIVAETMNLSPMAGNSRRKP
jgi:glycosyltransferase involved in cell wall biosynthesis